MIVRERLAAWLSDRESHIRCQASMNALLARWRERPLIADLTRELDALADPRAEEVAALAEAAMARSSEVEALVRDLIREASADPYFRPPFRALHNEFHRGLALFESPRMALAVGVMSVDSLAAKKTAQAGTGSIGFSGLLTSFRFLKSGNATLSFWRASAIQPGFTAQGSGRCKRIGERLIHDGETLRVDGRREGFVIEHATSDIVYLQAAIQVGRAPLAAEYDSRTLGFVGASSTDDASSRVQMMASLLRMMDRTDAGPVIERLLDSQQFYTRWHLMREYLALDAEAALPSLRQMAENDPHAEVRAAARRTLDIFFARAEPAAAA